ncbi:MAG: UDP-glucose/GDP-mannose dehydrogenase family protein [Pseudobdellovibrionaceae bacterium]
MKIAIVGTGYVGLVAGVCFADAGHHVTCVDNDETKIKKLKDGIVPIYEPGLEDMMKLSMQRLEFTTNLKSAVENNEVVFVAVGTPELPDGSADMRTTMTVCRGIAENANSKKYIVLKSTVPVGTAKNVNELVAQFSKHPIEIVSNPEFLKEGAAIEDFLRPDRVVIGCKTTDAETVMRDLYEPFLRNGNPLIVMDNVSAEMTKYAANAFLSVKISFINELARLADKMGADINMVRKGFTSDSRINPAFFYPGVGYGGSCFPKDVKALIHTGQEHGVSMSIINSADEVNDRQKLTLVEKAKEHFKDLNGLKIAVWGLAFKPRTDDVREAPALYTIEALVNAGAAVTAYDPAAMETFKEACKVNFKTVASAEEAVVGADALMILTEWNEFKNPDLGEVKKSLKSPVIFDGRNIFDPAKMKQMGFKYYCIGRQALA